LEAVVKILVTGAAGFIGSHLARQLIARGDHVVGVDNLNPYYDVNLKRNRLKWIQEQGPFEFIQADIQDQSLKSTFEQYKFDAVVNLAAQAGVRYSLENPKAYVDSNIVGFLNILELCRHHEVKHLVYASSSSVYGANTKLPFSETDSVDHPVSLYAASKKSNELMAHCYAHLFQLPVTGLRFFTVYGPWGRPDMALFRFVENMIQDKPIELYNQGEMIRDFTYVEDIVAGVIHVIDKPAMPELAWESKQNNATSLAPYRLYNIGHDKPVQLLDFVRAIENALGKKAQIKPMPMQAGDVVATHADVGRLARDFNYKPKTSVEEGIQSFVNWYRKYYSQ
jgi:UDP-glucuronate 4-epimerase